MIVVNYNGKRFLRECIDSLLHTDYPDYEILVVDNGSKDGSLESAEHLLRDPRVRQLRLEENVGYARACNLGARHISGKIVAFLNNDLQVAPGWLRPLASLMHSDPTIGALQPKLVLKDNPERLDSAGGFIDIFGCAHERRGLSTDFPSIGEIFYAKGAAIIVSSDLFAKLGGFDDDFFLYYEETDLCWRIWLSGHKILYAPEALVFHTRGATTRTIKRMQTSQLFLMTRLNRNKMILKNYEARYLLAFIPIILLNHFKDILLLIALGAEYSAVRASLQVPWCVLRDFKQIITKRRLVQASKVISNHHLIGKLILPVAPIFFPHELGDLPLSRRRLKV